MDIIISESFDSLSGQGCYSRFNTSDSVNTDFFGLFPAGDPNFSTILLMVAKFGVFCAFLYALKNILYFVYWLIFLPFNWTKVSLMSVCFLLGAS